MRPGITELSITSIAGQDPWLAVLVIVAATFIHEDLATVAVGIAAAENVTGVPIALSALFSGVVLGDLGLYGLGRLIALFNLSERFLDPARVEALKIWLDRRLTLGVFIVRFLPGLRLSAYTTYGFLAMPFFRFVLSAVLAASVWTTGLFYLSYAFGALTVRWLGYWQWPAIVLAFACPLLLVRRLLRRKVSTDR
jgi:membrane protein DedA with SNARE-associated domain